MESSKASPAVSEEQKELLRKKSLEAKANAYAPYSNFHVGAALLTPCGKIFTGCNVGNASYSLVVCAERTAVFKAVSEGYTEFTAVAVSSDLKEGLITPWGACRQVLLEFAAKGFLVIGVDPEGKRHEEHLLDNLLPHSFGPGTLSQYQKELNFKESQQQK